MFFALKTRIFLLILAICIIFPIFFTETLVVNEIEHECCTEEETQDCLPCLYFWAAINLLRNLKQEVLSSSPVLFLSLVQIPENYFNFNSYYLSPLELKVRFNT